MTISTTSYDSAATRRRSPWRPAAGNDRTSWRESAACAEADTELFFPIGRTGLAVREIEQAKAVCARCPVRQACLDYALSSHQQFGIWGGTDEDERRLLHRQRREAQEARAQEARTRQVS